MIVILIKIYQYNTKKISGLEHFFFYLINFHQLWDFQNWPHVFTDKFQIYAILSISNLLKDKQLGCFLIVFRNKNCFSFASICASKNIKRYIVLNLWTFYFHSVKTTPRGHMWGQRKAGWMHGFLDQMVAHLG